MQGLVTHIKRLQLIDIVNKAIYLINVRQQTMLSEILGAQYMPSDNAMGLHNTTMVMFYKIGGGWGLLLQDSGI